MNHAHPNENPPTLVYGMQTAQLLHEYDRIGTAWWDDHPDGMGCWDARHLANFRPRPAAAPTDTERGG